MGKKLFATSDLDGFLIRKFADVAQKIDVPNYFDVFPRPKLRIDLELLLFWRVLRATLSSGVALLFSSRGRLKPELLVCIVIGFLPKKFRPTIVLFGEMFQPDNGILRSFERFFMKLVDHGVCFYIVYSTAELEIFPKLWGVERKKMRFCPYYLDEYRFQKSQNSKKAGRHIFAGGNSHRVFEPIIETAKQLPEYEFILATKRLSKLNDFPSNVRVDWMSLDEYLDLINTAAIVIVPLDPTLERTSGLLTVLESLLLEKIIIVPDALGIRDYVTDGVTGLIVSNLPDGYINAIRWAFAPENREKVSEMCFEARRSVFEKFTLEIHVENLLSVMYEAIDLQADYSQE